VEEDITELASFTRHSHDPNWKGRVGFRFAYYGRQRRRWQWIGLSLGAGLVAGVRGMRPIRTNGKMTESVKPIVGLLGGPGAGKSFVARAFVELGAGLVDADALSRQAMQAPEVVQQLGAWWGQAVLAEDGGVDRSAVAERVFNDPAALKALESLIHPRVNAARARLHEQYQADPAIRAIVEDSPLLLEAGLGDDCDVLVFVEAPRPLRLERLQATRGWSEAELARREKQQWPLDTKRQRADYVIDSSAGEGGCFADARRVFSQLLHERVS
jgi:dephospho-CoA kinase